jgi:hypothetical protein
VSTGQDITVTDDPDHRRYVARAGDDLAGAAVYIRSPELIAFLHTEVEDAYAGRGVGSALARKALDDARAQGLRVLAICPFVDGWIAKHPDYEDLRYESASRVSD